MTKIKQKEDAQEEDDFTKFVSSAIRAPKGGAYEHLLSQLLAQSVICTDPLKKTKVVTEACYMIPERERENLAIDYETVEVLNLVANSMLNVSTTIRSIGNTRAHVDYKVMTIAWSFQESEENFNKFIKPWWKGVGFCYNFFLRHHAEIEYDDWGWPTVKKVTFEPYWSFFLDASQCLSIDGYSALKNSFSVWAIPIAQQYLAELTRVVSPGLYGAILGLYTKRGKKSYAEKVKEISEGPKEDESGLGPGL